MRFAAAFACCLLLGCATDSDEGASDRGGPDALTGFMWKTKVSNNGLDFLFGFQFSDTMLSASNTCTAGGESLTATVSVPVKYRYSADVPSGGHGGDAACFVDVAKGAFQFELAGSRLLMTFGGKVIEFSSTGTRSGLYGDWTAMVDGFAITWSMGGGKIHARADCPGGTTASVTVDAKFKNFVDIVEAGSKTVGDDTFNCSVGVSKALAEYRFASDALILTIDGKDTEFKHD